MEYNDYKMREIRNGLLANTDVMMLPDYPLTEEQRAKVIAYRKMLRDLPKQDGFPNIEIPKLEL